MALQLRGLKWILIGCFIKLSVQTFQPLILIYRSGNFVYYYWGCISIYRPLNYPLRSLSCYLFSFELFLPKALLQFAVIVLVIQVIHGSGEQSISLVQQLNTPNGGGGVTKVVSEPQRITQTTLTTQVELSFLLGYMPWRTIGVSQMWMTFSNR